MKYVDQFLSLRCAPDVLAAVGPLNHRGAKEIAEAMAVIQRVKRIVLNGDGPHTLIDLCSGNALVPVIAAHLFPSVDAYAVDKKPRARMQSDGVSRFHVLRADINESPLYWYWPSKQIPVIVTAVHACSKLALRVVELYQKYGDHLVMVPCCHGPIDRTYSPLLRDKLDAYELWAHHLAELAGGTVVRDLHMISPCNAVVTASKRPTAGTEE